MVNSKALVNDDLQCLYCLQTWLQQTRGSRLEMKINSEWNKIHNEWNFILAPTEASSLETCPKGTLIRTDNLGGDGKFLMGTESVHIRTHKIRLVLMGTESVHIRTDQFCLAFYVRCSLRSYKKQYYRFCESSCHLVLYI